MKKILKIFLIFFFLLSIGNIIYNSFPSKNYYPNGKLEYTLEHKNPFFITYDLLSFKPFYYLFEYGKFKGFETIYYYASGMIQSKGVTYKGFCIGLWEYYYENGNLRMKINFKEMKDYKIVKGVKTIGPYTEIKTSECWNKNGDKIECPTFSKNNPLYK